MRRRLLLLLSAAMAIALLGVSAPVAAAKSVDTVHDEDTLTGTIADVCAFDVAISAHQDFVMVSQYAADGSATFLWTMHEVDTFTANGKTLVGEPFAAHGVFAVNADGDVTKMAMTGIVEKVYLPDGKLFISAGFVAPSQDVPFYIAPDHGVTGDVEGFCAALAP